MDLSCLFEGSSKCFDLVTFLVCSALGIVLKNAKITNKGTSKSNVAIGKIVETLVILSPNIVQIVAEVGLFFINLLVEIRLPQPV